LAHWSRFIETWIEAESGHMNNLHLGAPRYYAKAIEWRTGGSG
jgi:hypothetical protein